MPMMSRTLTLVRHGESESNEDLVRMMLATDSRFSKEALGMEAYIPHFDRALFAFPAPGWQGTSELLARTVDGGRYRKQLEDLRLHRR
jgi:hypothetical protein